MRYRREDGSYVSQEDMDYLNNRKNPNYATYSNGGKMTPTKIWLLILATIFVIASIVFAAIQVHQTNQFVGQTQQVIDWSKQETQQLHKDLEKIKW